MIKMDKKILVLALLAALFVMVNSFRYQQYDDNYYNYENKISVRSKRSTNPIETTTKDTMDYLLPRDVIPTEYFIRLIPFIIPNNFTFNGIVKIIADVKKTTFKIVLHADLNVQDVLILSLDKNNNPVKKLTVKNISQTEKYQFLNLLMDSPITTGTKISIEISYTGILNELSVGFFRSSYSVKNETKWYAGTHLEPVQARNVFPCFDEPEFKAVFHISVVVPEKYTAISNMPMKSKKGNLVEFEKTPPMSTYIIAIVVSEFESISEFNERHPYKVWANPDLIDQTHYALSVLSHAIDFFETRFDIPFALPKLEIAAMPDFLAGAMENWGLPLYRESYILFDPKVTPIARKRFLRNAITHELSHQWFGDLVTPKRWDFLWISESFATYFEYHAHEDALNSWNLESQFVVNEMQPSFAVDAQLSAVPAVQNVYTPIEILGIFNTATYTKGSCLVRMLEKLLGPTMFYGGLRRYLLNNRFSTGTPALLFSAIEQEIKSNNYQLNTTVAKLLNSWTLQAGFPIVDVQFNGDIATLKQRRFLLKPSQNVTDESLWVIPINFATSDSPDFSNTRQVTWLAEKQKSITIKNACNDWVIVNVQQTGYYRVNYDTQMWRRIINILKSKNYQIIHEINRASIIDDLLNLARVGTVDYQLALTATKYLAKENSYIPWRAAFEAFNYLKIRFSNHPEAYETFKVYVLSLIEPNYKRLGFYDKAGEDLLDTHLRDFVLNWLCSLDHEECVHESLQAFEKLKRNKSVPANQQLAVYCTAIRHGSNDNWNFLWQKFGRTTNAIEKLTLLSALACSRNSANLERLLLRAITPNEGIRLHDADQVFKNVVEASDTGILTTLKFLENNYDKIRDYTGDEDLADGIITSISERLSTKKLIGEFENFVNKNRKNLTNISGTLDSGLETSNYEFNWYKKNSPSIVNWIKANYNC